MDVLFCIVVRNLSKLRKRGTLLLHSVPAGVSVHLKALYQMQPIPTHALFYPPLRVINRDSVSIRLPIPLPLATSFSRLIFFGTRKPQ
jgi:hypothetical protein